MSNAYKISAGKTVGKEQFGRPMCGLEGNIKMVIKGT
jgi:hypothetical protein